MERAYIGVGSNIHPEENIRRALFLLKERVRITGVSTFYRSRAVGTTDQPDFINGVFRIATGLTPRELKFVILRRTESELGRIRTADKNAPRTIDLDIVLCGALVVVEPDLVLPDPGLVRYPFVGVPLLEMEPGLIVPGTGKLLKEYFPLPALEYGLERLVSFSRELASLC